MRPHHSWRQRGGSLPHCAPALDRPGSDATKPATTIAPRASCFSAHPVHAGRGDVNAELGFAYAAFRGFPTVCVCGPVPGLDHVAGRIGPDGFVTTGRGLRTPPLAILNFSFVESLAQMHQHL
jgi:hypothetical protein